MEGKGKKEKAREGRTCILGREGWRVGSMMF